MPVILEVALIIAGGIGAFVWGEYIGRRRLPGYPGIVGFIFVAIFYLLIELLRWVF